MAKQFVVTAQELDKLISDVELAKLRLKERSNASFTIDEMHRAFNYVVVKWVQDVAGHKS